MAGPRIEMLQRHLEKLVAERDAHRVRQVDIARQLDEARRAHYTSSFDGKRSDALRGTPVDKLRRKKRESEQAEISLAEEISAVEGVISEKRAAIEDASFAKVIAAAERLTPAEEAGWKECGGLVKQLHEAWLKKVVAPAEQRSELGRQVHPTGRNPALEERFAQAVAAPVEPFPADFLTFVTVLVKIATDPYNDGYRADLGNSTPRLDHNRRLPALIAEIPTRVVNAPGLELRHSDRRSDLGFQTVNAYDLPDEQGPNAARQAAAAILSAEAGE